MPSWHKHSERMGTRTTFSIKKSGFIQIKERAQIYEKTTDLVYFRVLFGVNNIKIRIYFDINKNEIFMIES
jgi:hypothetical protein